MPTTLVIPDTHFPHHHGDTFDFLADLSRRFKPDRVVHIGDEIDAHAFGRWAKNPDLDSPGRELERAVECMKTLYKLFPKVSVCISNHTYRPWKQAGESGLPRRLLRDIREVFESPRGWRWQDYWTFDGVNYCHGDTFAGPWAAYFAASRHRRNMVIGHVHTTAAVFWLQGRFDRIFGASSGALTDDSSPVFNYGRYHPGRHVLGAQIVIDRVPHFHPLEV